MVVRGNELEEKCDFLMPSYTVSITGPETETNNRKLKKTTDAGKGREVKRSDT